MKASRNDPCPCGSGRKYKKCCLLKERNRDARDLEKIGELPLHASLITDSKGSHGIIIARERSNGNLAFISSLVDEWKRGLKDCFGGYDISKERFQSMLDSMSVDAEFVDASLYECKDLIKRGLLIAEEVGTRIPKEFDRFKNILGGLDDIQLTGSVYKCFECGINDLSDEIVEIIKEVTREDVRRGVCGTEKETKIYFVCDECKTDGVRDGEQNE